MGQNNKYLYFAIGVIVGISIGASVVWWMQNYDFKIWFTFSGKNDNTTEMTQDNEIKNNGSTDKQDTKNIKNDKIKKNTITLNQSDSLKNDYMNEVEDNDTMNVAELNNNNDIIVATDELLFTKNFKIEGSGSVSSNDKNLDSLLINDKTKTTPGNTLKVEFWRSPINYKGYKYLNNKLILFGIYDFENFQIEYFNNKLYIFSQKNYYLIEKNNDFKALIPLKTRK
jgi:hypothetical protein